MSKSCAITNFLSGSTRTLANLFIDNLIFIVFILKKYDLNTNS